MNQSDIIIFTTADEQVELNVRLEDDTVWLTQEQMATLFAGLLSGICFVCPHVVKALIML